MPGSEMGLRKGYQFKQKIHQNDKGGEIIGTSWSHQACIPVNTEIVNINEVL